MNIDKLLTYAYDCGIPQLELEIISSVCEMVSIYGDGYCRTDMLALALSPLFDRDELIEHAELYSE